MLVIIVAGLLDSDDPVALHTWLYSCCGFYVSINDLFLLLCPYK